jgi:hypothetical protein
MWRLDVRVGQVVNRVIVKVNLKQLCYPLFGEPLLLTHKHEPDGESISVYVNSGIEHPNLVGDVTGPPCHQVY